MGGRCPRWGGPGGGGAAPGIALLLRFHNSCPLPPPAGPCRGGRKGAAPRRPGRPRGGAGPGRAGARRGVAAQPGLARGAPPTPHLPAGAAASPSRRVAGVGGVLMCPGEGGGCPLGAAWGAPGGRRLPGRLSRQGLPLCSWARVLLVGHRWRERPEERCRCPSTLYFASTRAAAQLGWELEPVAVGTLLLHPGSGFGDRPELWARC